jgi:Flp pilus assembly protein TadG
MVRRLLSRSPRPGSLLRRFRRHRAGSAAVEFALVAPTFFALLFATLETGGVFFAEQVLENATEAAARLVLTGQKKSSSITAEDFRKEVCKSIPALIDCGAITIDVKNWGTGRPSTPVSPIVNGQFKTTGFGFDTGTAGDIIVVRLFYQLPLVVTGLGYNAANLSGNKRLLSTMLAFRNEPFV